MMVLEEIMKSLYFKKEAYFVDMFGKVKCNQTTLYNDRNNCTSKQHIEKWLAINDLLNVASFLNQGWVPKWESDTLIYIIIYKNGSFVSQAVNTPCAMVYFPTEKLARQAIDILGDQLLKEIYL